MKKLFNYIQNDPQIGSNKKDIYLSMIKPIIGIKENSIYWREFSFSVISMNIKDRSDKSMPTSS